MDIVYHTITAVALNKEKSPVEALSHVPRLTAVALNKEKSPVEALSHVPRLSEDLQ